MAFPSKKDVWLYRIFSIILDIILKCEVQPMLVNFQIALKAFYHSNI
ncbi:hypothetical protein SAMN04487919_1717 [Bacillus sp. ok061]|nr:hypothetical protein SAMN04487919_1717 [Bacillus sp. ok061]